MCRMSILRVSSNVVALLLIGAASAYGQTPGMICGTTTDSAGAVLAGVTVTLARDAETPAKTTTDSTGKNLFPEVSIGTYTLSFTLDSGALPRRTMRLGPSLAPHDL
jgi:hypothetical protein